MKEDIQGFAPPTNPPQMEADHNRGIVDLMFEAPKWDPSFASELEHLVRNHVALRSALALPLELAKQEEGQLLNADDPRDVHRSQGAIKALQRCFQILAAAMQDAETNKESVQ